MDMMHFTRLISAILLIPAVRGLLNPSTVTEADGLIYESVGQQPSITSIVQAITASPDIGVAPSLTPTIRDPEAPNPQDCPGYRATNIERNLKGVRADLSIAGPDCQALYVPLPSALASTAD